MSKSEEIIPMIQGFLTYMRAMCWREEVGILIIPHQSRGKTLESRCLREVYRKLKQQATSSPTKQNLQHETVPLQ